MSNMKYLIAVPCMDTAPIPFVAALTALKRIGLSKHSFLANSLIYDARNMLAQEAIETEADRILFIDSDMYFRPDMMERLAEDMDNGAELVTGLYFKRRFPTLPCIYRDVDVVEEFGAYAGKTQAYTDYPADSLFPIGGCGFGAAMMNVSVLKAVWDKFGKPFIPIPGALGEDLSFCWRARQLGYTLLCDSKVKVGHVGSFIFNEDHWLAQKESQK